jgi:hypothetical protein
MGHPRRRIAGPVPLRQHRGSSPEGPEEGKRPPGLDHRDHPHRPPPQGHLRRRRLPAERMGGGGVRLCHLGRLRCAHQDLLQMVEAGVGGGAVPHRCPAGAFERRGPRGNRGGAAARAGRPSAAQAPHRRPRAPAGPWSCPAFRPGPRSLREGGGEVGVPPQPGSLAHGAGGGPSLVQEEGPQGRTGRDCARVQSGDGGGRSANQLCVPLPAIVWLLGRAGGPWHDRADRRGGDGRALPQRRQRPRRAGRPGPQPGSRSASWKRGAGGAARHRRPGDRPPPGGPRRRAPPVEPHPRRQPPGRDEAQRAPRGGRPQAGPGGDGRQRVRPRRGGQGPGGVGDRGRAAGPAPPLSPARAAGRRRPGHPHGGASRGEGRGRFSERPGPFVRREAIDVLKDIGTRQSVPALQAVVDRNDGLNVGRARDAIAAIQARADK